MSRLDESRPYGETPGNSIHQVHIPFPEGNRYFSDFLMCLSTQERANLKAPVMVFDMSAQIAQIPSSVPANIKQTIVDNIKKTDLQLKPSTLFGKQH